MVSYTPLNFKPGPLPVNGSTNFCSSIKARNPGSTWSSLPLKAPIHSSSLCSTVVAFQICSPLFTFTITITLRVQAIVSLYISTLLQLIFCIHSCHFIYNWFPPCTQSNLCESQIWLFHLLAENILIVHLMIKVNTHKHGLRHAIEFGFCLFQQHQATPQCMPATPVFFHFLKHSMLISANRPMHKLYPLLRLFLILTLTSSTLRSEISQESFSSPSRVG